MDETIINTFYTQVFYQIKRIDFQKSNYFFTFYIFPGRLL
jgi:hypothetical protein